MTRRTAGRRISLARRRASRLFSVSAKRSAISAERTSSPMCSASPSSGRGVVAASTCWGASRRPGGGGGHPGCPGKQQPCQPWHKQGRWQKHTQAVGVRVESRHGPGGWLRPTCGNPAGLVGSGRSGGQGGRGRSRRERDPVPAPWRGAAVHGLHRAACQVTSLCCPPAAGVAAARSPRSARVVCVGPTPAVEQLRRNNGSA